MKTSLFNPIFINPLAYFVFPQLYDIIPEYEVLVEPCVFTGTLMVQTSNNTLVKFYKDTKSIDLSEFANSIITISLYTDIGATVLGLWVLYGKSTPTVNPHLVDAWVMSGLKNEDKPAYIEGINKKLIYPIDFSNVYGNSTNVSSTVITMGWRDYVLYNGPIEENGTYTIPSYKVEVKGLKENDWLGIGYEKYNDNSFVDIFKDGVYNIPSITFEYTENMPIWVTSISNMISENTILTITLIPELNTNKLITNNFAWNKASGFNGLGALVFDGIDDFLVCDTMPIMTDYTIIVKRKYVKTDTTKSSILISKRIAGDRHDGAFTLERQLNRICQEISFGRLNNIDTFTNNDITWQTKNKYNGLSIISADVKDSNTLSVANTVGDSYSNVAIYWIGLYDVSLTEEEINTEIIKLENEHNKRLSL